MERKPSDVEHLHPDIPRNSGHPDPGALSLPLDEGNVSRGPEYSLDITEPEQMKLALQASHLFLAMANRHTRMNPLIREFVSEIKALTGCEAVGIRILDEEGNIPYEAFDGFSQSFYETESPLSIQSDKCMCINVVRGNADPSQSFYTQGGSFYMNATSHFLATVSEEEKGQTRNVCNEAGYESVGLVPIRIGESIMGLIHVADHRENMVPPEKIGILENIAMQLGIALKRVQSEEELVKTLEKLEQRVEERTEALEKANLELRKGIEDRELDNRILQEYARNLKFLSRTSTQLVELSAEKNVYQFIGEKLKELVGDCVVGINAYEKETDSLCTRAVLGLGKYSQAVLKLMGRDLVGISFPINDEEARSQLATGKLKKGPPGLYELSFGKIPAGLCRKIEDLLSLGDTYGIGFACKGELFGSAIIITRRGSSGLKGQDIIETFIHQAAVALQRRAAEEALKSTHDELEKRVEERTAQLARTNAQLMRQIEERKRTEEALRESEEKFRTVSEQSPNMIFINRGGKVLYANKACEEIMGYKRDAYYASDFDFLSLVAPESIDTVATAFKRHMQGKDMEPYEYTLISKQGKRIEAIITTKLMNYEGERAILGIVTDITERKRVEEALRKSEESYRYLVENANDIIYKTDQTGHFTFFNPIAFKTSEYPPEYLLGRYYLELIHPDYRKETEKFYTSQFKERIPSTYNEFPIITKSGKEIWLGQQVQLIEEGDQIVGFHAVARDITERRHVEEALRKSEERYRQLVKHAPAAIFEYDVEKQKLMALNDVVYEFLGYTKEEIEALDPIDLVAEESHALYSKTLGKMLAGEEISDEVEYKLRGKGDKELCALVNARLILEQGKPRRATVVAHDITELKRAEEALRDSEKRLRSLSSKLIKAQEKERRRLSKELHDELGQALALLKHRMRSIQGNLEEGQSPLQEKSEEVTRSIDDIIENVRRLSRDLSPSILEDLGLSSALRWLIENFDKQYALMTSFEIDNVDHLFSKEAQTNLYRIAQEALTNIGKHAEAKQVSFTVKENEDRVSLNIEDDGKGFDMNEVRAKQYPEKGLGLDAMEERAHMLGASLHVRS
ncbi:MAG: PAS domain S-box protein, partial [Desulfobacteraceae bacterium]